MRYCIIYMLYIYYYTMSLQYITITYYILSGK